MRVWLAAALIALSTPCLAAGPSLQASAWNVLYSINMPRHPTTAVGGGWQLNFPRSPGELDYLTTRAQMRATTLVRVKLRLETVSGTPVYQGHNDAGSYCTGNSVATRVLLRKRNDNGGANGRFWQNGSGYVLQAGSGTMEIALTDLSKWSNVYGKSAAQEPAGFAALIKDLGSVGLTFGGCNNYGHGANTLGGIARLTVTEFTVQ